MIADTPPTPPAIVAIAKPLKSAGRTVKPRVVSVRWYVDYAPIPKAAKGCVVRYGHNNAAAKRMGLVAVTRTCP